MEVVWSGKELRQAEWHEYLLLMKKVTWKLIYYEPTAIDHNVGLCTGVCIQSKGLILTHATNVKIGTEVNLRNDQNASFMGKVCKYSEKSGLCLVEISNGNGFAFVRFGEESVCKIGKSVYSILYSKNSLQPILLMGCVAYENPRKIDDLDIVSPLDPNLALVQIKNLGASSSIQGDNVFGFDEGRGCPLLNENGYLVGVVLFQHQLHDYAVELNVLKDFVKHYISFASGDSSKPSKRRL